jgi:uncharacterized protein (TIGR03084 family)
VCVSESSTDIFADLTAEQDALEKVLADLSADAWAGPSTAPGWSVADVVLHLAQTEEAVVTSASGTGTPREWRGDGPNVDAAMDAWVHAERTEPAEIFQRWRSARRAAVTALRLADPGRRLPWVATPLKPRTLATTRLAEHWAHAHDVTDALGIDYPDTVRLRHIAWLGHGTLPYAFGLAGLEPVPVYCELTGPDGSTWRFGPPDAESTITGPAGVFCRVGARRLTPEQSGLVTTGPHADTALSLLRNYAST